MRAAAAAARFRNSLSSAGCPRACPELVEGFVLSLGANLDSLLQTLRFQRNSLLPGRLPLPVLANPGLPALAGGGVASGEGQGSDVGVRDGHLLVRILRD